MNSFKIAATALALAAVALAPAIAEPGPEEGAFITKARRLTMSGKRAGEGYFSASGDKIVFQSERDPENPFFQIFEMNLKTGETVRVSPGHGKTTCAYIHPTSGEVMFASTHLDPATLDLQKAELDFRESGKERRYSWDYDEHFDIFSVQPGTDKYVRLTDAKGYDAEGAYSPDGTKIVFASMRDAYSGELSAEDQKMLEINPSYFGEIYIMNADGTGQTRLTNAPGYDGGPFFSPDGKRIVWRRFDVHGMIADVWTMNIDGSDQTQVSQFSAMSWAPFFHESMKYIIFTTNKLGFSNFELYIVDAEGKKEPVRVTYSDGFDGLASFSPDGKRLTWTSGRGAKGDSQIWIANWNHEAALAALEAAPPATTAAKVDTTVHPHP